MSACFISPKQRFQDSAGSNKEVSHWERELLLPWASVCPQPWGLSAGLRQESCISMHHSPPGHVQCTPTHLILFCWSCRALCMSQAQKLCSFRAVLGTAGRAAAQSTTGFCITCYNLPSAGLLPLVTALILLFAPLSNPSWATTVGNICLYIHLSLIWKWENCSSPPPPYCDKDLVRFLLFSVTGKAQMSTVVCWSLPLCSAWFTKSAVIVCLAAYSIFGLCWGIDKSLCSV